MSDGQRLSSERKKFTCKLREGHTGLHSSCMTQLIIHAPNLLTNRHHVCAANIISSFHSDKLFTGDVFCQVPEYVTNLGMQVN